jgi:hypothetical protein
VQERPSLLCYDRIISLLAEIKKRGSNESHEDRAKWIREQLADYGLISSTSLRRFDFLRTNNLSFSALGAPVIPGEFLHASRRVLASCIFTGYF